MLSTSMLFNKGLFAQNAENSFQVIQQKQSPRSRNGHKHTKSVSIDIQGKQLLNRTTNAKMVQRQGPDLILNIRQLNVGKESNNNSSRLLYSKQTQELQKDENSSIIDQLLANNMRLDNSYRSKNIILPSHSLQKISGNYLNEIVGIEGLKIKEAGRRTIATSRSGGLRTLTKVLTVNPREIQNRTIAHSLDYKLEKRNSLIRNSSIEEFHEEATKKDKFNLDMEEQDILENSTASIQEHLIEKNPEKEKKQKRNSNFVGSSLDEQKLEARLSRHVEPVELKVYSMNNISPRTESNEPNSRPIIQSLSNLDDETEQRKPLSEINRNLPSNNDFDGWVVMKAKKSASDQTNKVSLQKQEGEANGSVLFSPREFRAKNKIRIKKYSNNQLKSIRKIKCENFDYKILKTCKKIRTIEENILSPLNDSTASEENSFTEYVEALKLKNSLRSL